MNFSCLQIARLAERHIQRSARSRMSETQRNCQARLQCWPGSRTLRRALGFSLLEMMVSLVIFLIVMGTIMSALSRHQKLSQTTQLKAAMYLALRGATELMAQEIGQAGLVSLPTSPSPKINGTVTASSSAQIVNVNSVVSMFVGEKLLIDIGPKQETVTVSALSSSPSQMTAIFSNSHASGTAINVLGVIWNGVMSTSTATQLQLVGDINADGSLVYVHYDCDTTAGTLTRSTTTVTPSATSSNASQVLLNNLIANPGGTPCFLYTTQQSTFTQTLATGTGSQTMFQGVIPDVSISPGTVSVTAGMVTGTDNGSGNITGAGISSGTVNYTTGAISVTFSAAPSSGTAVTTTSRWNQTLITNVTITLSVETSTPDPQTGQYQKMTKSLLNLAPRNVMTALELANSAFMRRLQPTPPNLPLS